LTLLSLLSCGTRLTLLSLLSCWTGLTLLSLLSCGTRLTLLSLLSCGTGLTLLSKLSCGTRLTLLSLLSCGTGLTLLSKLSCGTGLTLLSLLSCGTGLTLLSKLSCGTRLTLLLLSYGARLTLLSLLSCGARLTLLLRRLYGTVLLRCGRRVHARGLRRSDFCLSARCALLRLGIFRDSRGCGRILYGSGSGLCLLLAVHKFFDVIHLFAFCKMLKNHIQLVRFQSRHMVLDDNILFSQKINDVLVFQVKVLGQITQLHFLDQCHVLHTPVYCFFNQICQSLVRHSDGRS
jgi:hypothetical protein